jgi:hypothetical protein
MIDFRFLTNFQKFAGRGGKGVNSISSFFFFPSFGGSHAGLRHEGQGPITVEATITTSAPIGGWGFLD